MSEWGDVVTALEAKVRAGVTLPTGALGFEQGVRPVESLRQSDSGTGTNEFPHVFAHDPTDQATPLKWQQLDVRAGIQLDLWTLGETQEQVNAKIDAIRDQIKADPTLGGLVDHCFVSRRATVEAQFLGRKERAGIVLVEWRKVVR